MTQLIRIPGAAGPILVEVPGPPGAVRAAGRLDDAIADVATTIEDGFKTLESVARSFEATFLGLASSLESAELELGLQFTGKGSVFVVESEAEAAFKVKLVFEGPRAKKTSG
jgi:hypothetical protein